MIEEPYRWVEAIANRREYIESQLGHGSPIVALSCRDGILLLTIGRTRQKLFEIYDRIAMGAVGHPGDIERLRMAAIELASTEGFARAAADVSLRRLAHYSLSPVLKTAFEQIYGAPYLARMLFAEIGKKPENDLFLRVDYDGAIGTNSGTMNAARQDFGVLAGTLHAMSLMETFLGERHRAANSLGQTIATALDAWTVGQLSSGADAAKEIPAPDVLATERKAHARGGIEAALLERTSEAAIRYRTLLPDELAALGA